MSPLLSHCPITAYYDNESKDYWVETSSGWLCLTESSLTRWLRCEGYNPRAPKDEHASQTDKIIRAVQNDHRVDYAGPLAGWHKGLYQLYGRQTLVTSSPRLLDPSEGEWPIFRACLDSLFGRVDPRQTVFWLAHHKIFLECLYNQRFRPGPASFLIGKKDCGKSFIQDRFTDASGERVADPWLYINGGTPFNRELFAAEHLRVSDPKIFSSSDRNDFSNMIKNMLMDEPQSCHGKFREAVTLPPRRRLTVSANNELHNMGVIPSLDDSMLDKMNLYLCAENSIPPAGYEHIPYDSLVSRIRAELPHYVWHLLNEFKIPVEIEARRCGARTYHHPDLVSAISDNLPEIRLLNVMEDFRFFANGPWMGTYEELANQLGAIACNASVKPFANSLRSLPHLLSKLHMRFPARVQQIQRTKTRRQGWIIYPSEDQPRSN